jgi:uncharacterized pyridoxamine 5'-phosphate oxidase family protein
MPKKVTLKDTISVGCNGCGDCCISSQFRTNAFDIYRLAKVLGKDKTMDALDLYFGEKSGMPTVSLETNVKNTFGKQLCKFSTMNKNGDCVCSLGEYMPVICSHPFIAIAICFDDVFNFVPLDQEVPKINIDDYLAKHSIENEHLYFLDENNSKCHSTCKKNITVEQYLSKRIKYNKEICLANICEMLLMKYIKVDEFMKIIYLADHSKLNQEDDALLDKFNYNDIEIALFGSAYFYTDVDSKTSFVEQTLKHIKHLEEKKYPVLRLLYKYLYRVYDPSMVIMKDILREKDINLAQDRFDNYFKNHYDEIAYRIHNDLLINLPKEAEQYIK